MGAKYLLFNGYDPVILMGSRHMMDKGEMGHMVPSFK